MNDEHPVLRGTRVLIRPRTSRDLDALVTVLTEPAVAQWWGQPATRDALQEELDTAEDAITLLAIEVEGEVAGAIEYWEERDPEYRHASIDIFLSERFQDRGLGTEALHVLTRFLLLERGHHRLTIDPAADNARAVRCYEKVGFRPVGVMRQYERRSDGTFRDGLLMELLRDEVAD